MAARRSPGRSDVVAPIGVVVAQMGGPEDLAAVEPFIGSIFADPHLVPLPGGPRARAAIGGLVARFRAPRVRSHYEAIGGGSPIVETTRLQADALDAELAARGNDVVVAVANRHSSPDTGAAVEAMQTAGVGHIVLLPLYPQYSTTTTGSSEAELRRVLGTSRAEGSLTVIRSWCEHPSYLDLQARLVDEMLDDLTDGDLKSALVVFSAHGLPERIVDRGDPYVEEVEATVAAVVERLERPVEHTVAYQSRVGPVRWVGPDVRRVVATAASDGRPWLGVVPISFVSDHLETLYELDIRLKDLAEATGIGAFRRSRCLDLDPAVGPMLADIVEECL